MQKMGKSNQKETNSINRNLVGKVRLAIIKCPRLAYSPYLTDKKSARDGQKLSPYSLCFSLAYLFL